MPVLLLHVALFGRRYPLYKYGVVAAVTAGVAIFTLHTGSGKKRAGSQTGQTLWGLLLLAINLLFDGLTNTTQAHVFAAFQPYTGPQMMCANNLMQTLVTGSYLVLSPWLVHTGIGEWLGMDVAGSAGELRAALAFMARHPAVWRDVLGFAACGAVGQIFICECPLLSLPFPEPDMFFFAPPCSLRLVDLLLRLPRYRHRHPQDGDHDPVRCRLRPPPLLNAVAGCRSGLRRHRRRGSDYSCREDGQGKAEAAVAAQ